MGSQQILDRPQDREPVATLKTGEPPEDKKPMILRRPSTGWQTA
jgi:hypothetical protein